MPEVQFEPDGIRSQLSVGVSILELAESKGIYFRSECGKKGNCGKCRVIIENQGVLINLTQSEKDKLTPKEISLGYRLACCAIIVSDKENLVVMVPEESWLRTRKLQVSGLEKPVNLQPAIQKVHITMAKPSLIDNKPDVERLLDQVCSSVGQRNLKIEYDLLRNIAEVLRDAEWNISAVVWNDEKIIEIEAGDTREISYGLAIDIGTSKIVVHLVNLINGKTVERYGIENPQTAYGEDVITRIKYAERSPNGLQKLRNLIVDDINVMIRKICDHADISSRSIYEATVVGNTAMHHIFLGIQPQYLALAPYIPAVKNAINLKAQKLGLELNPQGNVHFLPIIAGFVGADAIGDLLATGMYELDEACLLIDIGTNTEVFLGNKNDILCCSCASGPAFEGVHIKHGMKAVTGAIEKIRINPKDFEVTYETIDRAKPAGICGSGIIDVIAELFKCGIINQKGQLNDISSDRLQRTKSTREFIIAWREETVTDENITITQQDIREIQLAKAAIGAACSILMQKKNVTEKNLDKVFIAGAFGNYINPSNAVTIGLIPAVPTGKIIFIGNAAVSGAKMCLLSREIRKVATLLSRKARYLELASDPDFEKEFIRSIHLPPKSN